MYWKSKEKLERKTNSVFIIEKEFSIVIEASLSFIAASHRKRPSDFFKFPSYLSAFEQCRKTKTQL